MAKATERHINELATLFVYAALEDVESDFDGDERPKFDKPVQTYSNLCQPKDKRIKALKARFTLSEHVKEMLSYMFNTYIVDVNQLDTNGVANAADLISRATSDLTESIIPFMDKILSTYSTLMGDKLTGATSPSNYISVAMSKQFQFSNTIVVAVAYDLYYRFMKALACLIGRNIAYSEYTVSEKFMLGLCSQHGMTYAEISSMRASLSPKKPPKNAATSKPAVVTATTADGATTQAEPAPTPGAVLDIDDIDWGC